MTLKEAFVYVGNTFVNAIYKANGAVTLSNASCNLSCNVWRHCGGTSCTKHFTV